MHPASLIQLAHGCINDRVPGLTGLPGMQVTFILIPMDLPVNGVKRGFEHLRMICNDLVRKNRAR